MNVSLWRGLAEAALNLESSDEIRLTGVRIRRGSNGKPEIGSGRLSKLEKLTEKAKPKKSIGRTEERTLKSYYLLLIRLNLVKIKGIKYFRAISC